MAGREIPRNEAQPGSILVVVHDFNARSSDELSLAKGDKIELIERDEEFNDGWFLGRHTVTQQTGLFPQVYTTPAKTNTTSNGLRRTSGSMPHAVQAHELPASTTQRPASASTVSTMQQRPNSATSSFSKPSNATSRSSLPSDPSSKSLGMASAQSPVMHETLTVIDEHMNDMNPASLRANGRRDTMSSMYSSHPNRMSYIAGHETEDEESQLHTEAEVMSWTPDQVAEYLEDHGVERPHCKVFLEQEITGEVLLAMDQSSVFLKEFDLGPVGRRLRTWHKIKALQDEIQRNTSAGAANTDAVAAAPAPELESNDIGRARSTSAASALQRNVAPLRNTTVQPFSQPTSATSPAMSRSNSSNSPLMNQTSTVARQDSAYRPSAQNIRTMQHWRHSSVDSNGTSLDSASVKTGHRKQSSTDQSNIRARLSTHSHNISADATSYQGRDAGLYASPISTTNDVDKGYFSSTEVESRSKKSGVLQRKQNSMPVPATNSRNNSFRQYTRKFNPSNRAASTDSLDKQVVSPATSPVVNQTGFKSNAPRTISMPTYGNKTMSTVNDSAPPVVTKLEHNSPTSTTAAAAAASALSSAANTPNSSSTANMSFFSKTSKIPGMRVISDAVTRHEKSSANGTATPKESELSPIKDGLSTPSTGAPSFDFKSGQRTSTGSGSGIVPQPAPRKKRTTTKKTTSAYTRGLEKKTPAEQMIDCDYSGWMKKKSGSLMTTWKSRLFVLRGRRLSYYYSEDDTEEKGLIDISFHNVMPAMDEKLVSMHAAVTGVGASPTSPKDAATTTAAQQDLKDNPPREGADDDGLFIFKLTPPKAGRGVNFTKPTVHYFAVNSRQEGRLWMAALMKAVINRDQDGVVTTTYNQKTISLAKARARKERPPALKEDTVTSPDSDVEGLGIGGISRSNGDLNTPPAVAVGGADGNERSYLMEDGSSLAASTIPTTTTPSVSTDFDGDREYISKMIQ